jgi:hypothetical protein
MSPIVKRLACTLAFGLVASAALSAEWTGPWPSKDRRHVFAGFEHDDGGTLQVQCDTQKHLMSLALKEPRATWKAGDTMDWQTRADDGSQRTPSTGVVIGPNLIVVEEQSTHGIYGSWGRRKSSSLRESAVTREFGLLPISRNRPGRY